MAKKVVTTKPTDQVTEEKIGGVNVDPNNLMGGNANFSGASESAMNVGAGLKKPEKSKYRFGWDKEGATFGSVIRGEAKDVPIEQVLPDYLQYVQDNNLPEDYVSLFSTMRDRDISKSYAENEKNKKRQQMSDMWDGIGNVLISLGSFAGAAAGGPIPTNMKDPAELTDRQRALRDKTLAQRNAYNKDLFALMKQQKADEYNRRKIDLEERKQNRLDEQQRLYYRKQDWLEKYQQGLLDDKAERRRIDEEYKKGTISLKEKNTAIAEFNAFTRRMNANRAAQGSTTETVDQYGNRKTVVKKIGTNGGAQGGGTGKTLGLGIGQ